MSEKLGHHKSDNIEARLSTFYDVEVVIIHINGTAYMTALDVGRALGYEDPRHVRSHLDELDKGEMLAIKEGKIRQLRDVGDDSTPISIGSKTPSIILVTRSDAQALAIAAGTDRAREFRRWIRKAMLPEHCEQVTEQPSQPTRPPTLAELREARLMQKENEAALRAVCMFQKAMAGRERQLMRRDERDAEMLATAMKREEREAARHATAMKRMERESAKLATATKREEHEAARHAIAMERMERESAKLATATKREEHEAARHAIAMERMERESARLAIAMEHEERESAKLILVNCDKLAAAPGIRPEAVASLRILAIKQLFGLSLPGLLPTSHPEIVWDSASDIARRFEVSLKRVSKIIKELGIRNEPDMFCITLAKAPRSEKIVEVYQYSPTAVERIEAAIREWLAKSSSK